MVAIRHAVASPPGSAVCGPAAGGGHQRLRTTLILLCEDGSLKIYMANPDHTEFWLSGLGPSPVNSISQIKPPRRRRIAKASQPTSAGERGSASGVGAATNSGFPVDFFESSSLISDLEYGGNDVLQVRYLSFCPSVLKNRTLLNCFCTYALSRFTACNSSATDFRPPDFTSPTRSPGASAWRLQTTSPIKSSWD